MRFGMRISFSKARSTPEAHNITKIQNVVSLYGYTINMYPDKLHEKITPSLTAAITYSR